ncbi:hypothetical protein [Burkholderia oklahomensis]|uniref:BsaU protein n=1 Tax=Burkholderia oklahomensis TaxID=342113 RepID=A0AAI8BBE5_9BURK|nr:hypothetical protein [Burkholderia oklahomensis]AIO69167.1 putative bsaU protein [Burkholderia oklahomensis]AOI38812.1 BsaU protein [Burkholderia oklahomensis EO147]KUY63322.1 BsaU protein [Burkholderia oklahomensis EO147]MDN7674948.1 BsaU protein [Burkholderia oklahomensis]QPS40839.1 BsaU protein [Burkholderia oklahomensis]
MSSTISISAPIASAVEPAPRAEPAGVERTTDLQRAYREQCSKVLDKRDGGCHRDDADTGRALVRKKTKRKGEPLVAAVWMSAPHQMPDRVIASRFGDARRGVSARDAGVEAGTASRAETSVAPRGETVMRDDMTARDAARATGERTLGASIVDARVSRAAVESAPSLASAQATQAAPEKSDGVARVMTGEAASRSPSPSLVTATAIAAATATRRSPAVAPTGAAHDRTAGDDPGRPGDASLAGFQRSFQPQASMHAAEPPAHGHDPSRAARQRVQVGTARTDGRDVGETQGTQVRYSFNSWDGRPTVELRFDPGGAPRVVNAQPSHERVQRAMEHGVDRLTPGWTVEFDRQRADDDGGRSPWRRARQEPEEDER